MEFTSTLKKNYEFRRLYSKGKSCANAYLVVYCRKNHSAAAASATPCPTRSAMPLCAIASAAACGRFIACIEREIVRGYDLVVVSRVRACAADYHQLETAFLSACAKLGLLTEGDGGA